MHALTIFFASLSLLAGLAATQGIPGGDLCCGNPIDDPNKSCPGTTFCCDTGSNANIGRGCDDNKDFPVGRSFSGFGVGSCKSGGSTGTVVCG
ncbi:uncharacterized protein LY79DRAFT_572211 [Colletotrichum navitas]|uniref:Uncharacterized protein n=1 Tax=Colletotrichum navitas TaxID=681940 RepID=A0AAD8UYT7_9PEZI|nr:uncharacterized protein LY79DRAFT_572211 [Colletotrichum navitas]KAK1566375.1 hypothetical protein LY79DRAFT_572211 [Colletotrichum navitas]